MGLLDKITELFFPSPEKKAEREKARQEKEYTLRAKKYGYINCIREYDGFEDNMNLKLYSFNALWPETGRKRSDQITAANEIHAKELILKKGFQEPIELERINYESATDRQIAFMEEAKMFIPKHFCKEDAHAIINNYCENDSRPNPGLVEFAQGRKLNFSYFDGKRAMYNTVFGCLKDEDKIAFFIFSIYRYYSDDREANLDKSPHKDIFYNFSAENINNTKFIKSMKDNYHGEDLRIFGTLSVDEDKYYGSSTKTAAFKTAMNYLTEQLGIQYVSTKKI